VNAIFLVFRILFSPSCFGLSHGQWDTQKSAPRDGTAVPLFSLENQLAVLLNGGRHPAWAALATGTARIRWGTAFRIFWWLEIPDFDLVFLFLVLGLVLHANTFQFVCCFCCVSDVISVPSLMYCVKFLDPLRGKFASRVKVVKPLPPSPRLLRKRSRAGRRANEALKRRRSRRPRCRRPDSRGYR